MNDPELEHLAPDFDPRSLTVPRLRAILVAHEIDYPSSAKKPELVDIFNEHVVPQARKILKARSKTRPTTSGITDAPSTRASSVAGDDDAGFIVATVEDTPRRTSRKSPSKRASVGPSSRASTVERKRSSFSDTEGPDTVGRRQTRHSLGVPAAIKEELVDVSARNESPFSSDNPFQSGSSPLVDGADDGDAHRRRSGLSTYKTPSKTPNRNRTSVVSARARREDSYRAPSEELSAADEVGEEYEGEEETEEDYSSEGGEEFTPEELEELETEEQQGLTRREKRPSRKASGGGALRSAPWAILLALLGGFATVWRQEKLNVGYCGIGRPSTSVGGVEIPEWAQFLRPECEPCPQHAYCYGQLETQCEPDFILQPHPLSAKGIVPIPPTCEPDGKKARNVKAVADRGINVLRERNAQWECGDLKETDGSRAKDPRMAEADLKAVVSGKRRRGMSQDEFEDLWASALPEMQGRDEVSADIDGSSGRRLLRSNSIAKLGLACALRRSVRLAVARHLWKLVAVVALVLAAAYARFSITNRRSIEGQAKRLASIALDRLATQAAQHQRDAVRAPEAYLGSAQLRDDMLRDEFSARKRQALWARVQAKVEANSNVRPMVRQGRTGEVGRVWEWIGAVKALEDAPPTPAPAPAPAVKRPSVSEAAEERTKRDRSRNRTWPDSRPIF